MNKVITLLIVLLTLAACADSSNVKSAEDVNIQAIVDKAVLEALANQPTQTAAPKPEPRVTNQPALTAAPKPEPRVTPIPIPTAISSSSSGSNSSNNIYAKKEPTSIKVEQCNQNANDISNPDIYENVKDKTVRIRTSDSVGSGTIITPEGHLLTNYHVIKGFKKVIVIVDQIQEQGTVIHYDKLLDIALVKIDKGRWPFLKMSDCLPRVGEKILVNGYPRDIPGGSTLTAGLVSQIRNDPQSSVKYIQTDSSINPGNSGGTALDGKGRFIGIPASILPDSEGIGFVISLQSIENQIYNLFEGANYTKPIYDPTPTPTPTQDNSDFTTGDLFPDWSPDGNQIVFSTFMEEIPQIGIMNIDGSNRYHVTSDSGGVNPDWAPDGSKILYSSVVSVGGIMNFDLFVINTDGSNKVRLTNDLQDEIDARWSPNGNEIIFSVGDDVNEEIYVINSDGSNRIRLTNNAVSDSTPSWSPDGNKIAFVSIDDNNYSSIYTMNSDGTNQKLMANNTGYDYDPDWSPDGTKITYVNDNEVYVMNIDGSNRIPITNNSNDAWYPHWSSDGSKIIYGDFTKIYIINMGNNEKVTPTPTPSLEICGITLLEKYSGSATSPTGASITLDANFKQNGCKIEGLIEVSAEYTGTGPFKGSISGQNIEFLVSTSQFEDKYTGIIDDNGIITGLSRFSRVGETYISPAWSWELSPVDTLGNSNINCSNLPSSKFLGTLTNETYDISSNITATLEQNKCNITGNLNIESPTLGGSGPLNGSIINNIISFTVPSATSDATVDILFKGTIENNKLTGNYSTVNSQGGIWNLSSEDLSTPTPLTPSTADNDPDNILIKSGEPITSDIYRNSDEDLFTFKGVKGQKVTITMVGIQPLKPYLSLYKETSNYPIISANPFSIGNIAVIEEQLLDETGTYTIYASSYYGSSKGTYVLEIRIIDPDENTTLSGPELKHLDISNQDRLISIEIGVEPNSSSVKEANIWFTKNDKESSFSCWAFSTVIINNSSTLLCKINLEVQGDYWNNTGYYLWDRVLLRGENNIRSMYWSNGEYDQNIDDPYNQILDHSIEAEHLYFDEGASNTNVLNNPTPTPTLVATPTLANDFTGPTIQYITVTPTKENSPTHGEMKMTRFVIHAEDPSGIKIITINYDSPPGMYGWGRVSCEFNGLKSGTCSISKLRGEFSNVSPPNNLGTYKFNSLTIQDNFGNNTSYSSGGSLEVPDVILTE